MTLYYPQTAIAAVGEEDLRSYFSQHLGAGLQADVVSLADKFQANGVPPYNQLSVTAARQALEHVTRLQTPPAPVVSVRDMLLPGQSGLLPARVYNPDPKRPLPLVVYLHGGGWVLGSIAAADGPCRRLSLASDCIVVSLEYRRAPETRFPGPLEDCLAALRWLGDHAAELGATAQLTLMGDSAGGNLVAAACQCIRDQGGPRIDRQVLLYPCLQAAHNSPFASYQQHAQAPLMTRGEMQWFWEHYLSDPSHAKDSRAAPLLAADVSGLPPATIVVAECDVLRDEGLCYAQRLRSAGVTVGAYLFAGSVHGFWWLDAALAQATELDYLLADVLREQHRAINTLENTNG
jgi:acetyl esterase